MKEDNTKYEGTQPCEGSADLNGKDASYRNAAMISAPRSVLKRRIRGASVPMGNRP